MVLGCGILAFGMTIVIKSQAGTGPNDLVAVVISDRTRWKFGPVRIAVDMGFALTGFLLGGTVGVGTLICMAVLDLGLCNTGLFIRQQRQCGIVGQHTLHCIRHCCIRP